MKRVLVIAVTGPDLSREKSHVYKFLPLLVCFKKHSDELDSRVVNN